MAEYIKLPDGSFLELKEGQSPIEGLMAARQAFPDIFGKKEAGPKQDTTGFKAAAAAGLERLKGEAALTAGKLGLMGVPEAEQYQKEREAAAQARFTPTQEGWTEAPFQKFKETLGGSLPYMAAPAAAGLAALAAPVAAPTAALIGAGAAGLTSAAQFTGSNIARQMETGKSLEEASLGQAALAALPQAALDTLSLKMMPGIRNLFAEAGKELTAPVAKRIAEQGLKEVAKDYALATGKTMGMEGLTESGQQVFERLQAGLSLTDEKARDEYLENFLGGAVMGGVLAPGGRFVERRGEAKKQEQERLDKAMAERAKEEEARAKEAAFRATPEGALQFVEDYETRQARLNEIKDIKKPGKDATPLEQAEFDDIKKEREGLRKQLYKDSTEYKEAKAKADTLLEQRRVEKMSPEDFMLEQLGVTTPTAAAPQTPAAPPKMRTVVDEFGQVTEVPEGVEETEAATPAQTYMEGQVRAAQEAGRLGLDEYADYIMQDPKMAAEVVKTRTKMPGLTGTENSTLLSGVSLRLRDIEKQRAAETRAVMEQRAADLRAQQPTPEIETQLAEIEQRLAETAEKGPSYVEPTFDYLDPLFEKALGGAPVIQVSETVRPTTNAAATRARVEALMREADQADKDYQLARRVERKPDAAIAAKQRGKNAIDQIAALSKEGNDYAREFLATRNQQMESLAKLTDIAEQLRTGQVLGKETYVDEQGRVQPVEPGKGVAAATEQSLRDKADKVRANLITSVLQEAATHRRAAGQQPITQDEALIAASKLDDTVKAWMDRAMAKPTQPEFEEVIVEPAQMRGTKIVRPAKTERREVKPGVKGISPAEMAHFQSRIEAIRSQLSAPAPGPKQRAEAGLLRRQYATEEQKKVAEARGETAETLGGELRRRAEYVRNKMGRMQLTPQNVGKAWLGTRNALNKAADALDSGKATRELLDAVEPVVDAVLKKVEIKPVDLRAIDDALKAMAPTAQEQKEAGQKQLGLLFQAPGERARLAETDLGYVRMTPQAFANSPKIKAVWAALDKARAALKRKAAKQATAKQRSQAAAQTLTRLKGAIDNIKADTKFFWADTSKWTDTQLAKAYAGYPEIGNNPEEQALVDKYLKGTDEDRKLFTQEEKEKLDLLFRRFRDTKMPQYQQRMQEAMTLLAQGQRLDDLDNQLLQVMQDANASTVKAVTEQRKELAVLREAIKQIKTLSKNEKVSPLAKRVEALQKQADKARSKYNERVELLYKDAYKRMDDALAEILDPEIKRTNEEIAKAKNTLEAEKANLDKIKKNFENILAQKEGANRTELATYELFRYEEKLDVIKDLEKKIEEYEASLAEDMETRFEAHDQAAAVLEAVMDKKVQAYRDRVVALEEQIATLRGEGVLAVEPGGRMELPSLRYPMAAQKYEADLKAAEAALKDVKRQQVETQERAKSQAQQMDEFWKDRLGGIGIKREKGRVEPIVSEKEKQLEKLRREEREKADRAYEAERKEQIKNAQVESIDNEVAGLVEELGAYEEFPNELAALKKMAEDESLPAKERDAALAKAGIIQNIESLEAQREVLLEGKPAKKRGPATAPSTAAMGAQKPLRTGYKKALSEMSEGLRREREGRGGYEEGGVYGEAGEEAPDLRGLFRTTEGGAGMSVEAVEKVAAEAREGWEVVPPVVVVQSEKGLPIRIYKQLLAQNMEGRAPGLYDPKTKKVYLIADNLHSPRDVALTVAHEIAGHFGLREMLGGEYHTQMQSAFDGNEAVRTAALGKMDADKSLSQDVAVEEVLADIAETGPNANSQFANALRNILYAVKQAVQKIFGIKHMTDGEVRQLVANARRYVKTGKGKRGGPVDTSGIVYRQDAVFNDAFAGVGDTTRKIVAKQRSWTDNIKANTTGLAFETQLVDRFAGFERLRKYMDPHKGAQMLYYMRMYDQRMNFVSQAVSNGAPQLVEKTRPDGGKEFVIEAKDGASIANVVKILSGAQKHVGNAEAVNQLFTTYLAALRADRVGLDALNFGGTITQDMLDKAKASVNGNADLKAVFEKARGEYNSYNRNMIDFVASTGALSEEVAKRLAATNDYIPFYRERNGVAEMIIGGEAPIRVGSIAEQPYLHELVGGDQPILDFMTSSVQNTNMLVDMGLRNMATKNAVFELVNLNAAKIVKAAEGPDVVKFKVDGKDRYAVISSEKVTIGSQTFDTGVPADLLVKGMEGIPTQMPMLLRAMSAPAQLLRKAVTLSPLYMAKQLFRDSLAAPIISGADFTPIMGALKQIGSPTKGVLERRGITGGQVFHGTSADLTKILRDIADGKPGWQVALGKLEAAGMEADALTRRAQYNSYIKQGMSEMEATLMALESMNFNKRGASPSVHMANAMIPFFNAQIQGLNVLYKALRGQMPANDKLKIRQKLLLRGGMMAAASLVYAMLMEDDEAYKNANPDQKYGNWFIRVPGVDEPVKLPVPFEIGYIFKALPEALYNSMTKEHGGEEAVKAFRQILLSTVPGGTNYGIPQALKPAIEAGLGKSFYTGRDMLSAREKDLLPEEQFRANTSEMAKAMGKTLGFSPVIFENLVRGYTGTLGLAFLHALSVGMPKTESPEAAVKRLSEYPIVGGAFQPNDAGGITNSVYEQMNEDIKVRAAYKKMLTEGRTAEANDLLQRRGNEIMEAELGDAFKSTMNKLTQAERAVQASNLSAVEKRRQLDEIRKMKTAYATTVRDMADKTIRLSSPL